MKTTFVRLPITLLICACAQLSLAATVSFLQAPLAGGDGFLSDLALDQNADDFSFAAKTNVTSVRWWGTYLASAPEPDQFTLRFFGFDQGAPQQNPSSEFTNLAVTRSSSGLVDIAGDTIFKYEAQLPSPMVLNVGATAFISVLNSTNEGWFWQKSSSSGSNWFRFDDLDPWDSSTSGNLAFEIIGVQGALASGTKYHDLNANGVRDASEPGLADWTINLTGTNEDGQPVNLSTATDASGNYSFSVAPGTYNISEASQPGWNQSSPASGQHNVTLAIGQEQTGNLFGNYQNATAGGTAFRDLNADGVHDADDPGLENWTINLTGTNGAGQSVDLSTMTDATGNYSFDVAPGSYVISEVLQPDWFRSSPASGTHSIMLTSGQVLGGIDFGNFQSSIPGDYNGDLTVDDSDYAVWRGSFGQMGQALAADGNGNGAVDAADYVVWRNNLGAGPGLSSAAVPEPATVAVTALFGLCVIGQVRLRRLRFSDCMPATTSPLPSMVKTVT